MDQPSTPRRKVAQPAAPGPVAPKVSETPVVPQPRKLRVATVGPYPINCWPITVVVHPGFSYEVPEHPWIQNQIRLGTLREV